MQLNNRLDPRYQNGVESFLQFAYSHRDQNNKMPCPCVRCNNFRDQPREVVEDYLIVNGIRKSYVRWIYHGENVTHNSSDYDIDNDDNIGTAETEADCGDDDMIEMLNHIGNAN